MGRPTSSISGIYKITNVANGKCYIGSAINIKKRWQRHNAHLNTNRHHSLYLQRAWNEYSETSFIFELLLRCEKKDLIFFEQRAIDTYKPDYNMCQIAGSRLGTRHSEETREKMRQSHLGRVVSEDTKQKHRLASLGNQSAVGHKNRAGKPCSEQTKQRLSAAATGDNNPMSKKRILERQSLNKNSTS